MDKSHAILAGLSLAAGLFLGAAFFMGGGAEPTPAPEPQAAPVYLCQGNSLSTSIAVTSGTATAQQPGARLTLICSPTSPTPTR